MVDDNGKLSIKVLFSFHYNTFGSLTILSSSLPGFNPMWEETLVFNIQMSQIALVRFQVWDHDPIGRNFIGQRTIAFTSMMPGTCP